MNRPLLVLALIGVAGVLTLSLPLTGFGPTGGQAKAADKGLAERAPVGPGQTRAIFAGGCFWCMEKPFDDLDGVVSTQSGYIAGQTENPTYREVSAGSTGHTEAVEVVFDPGKVSYEQLLEVFWVNIDPTVKDRQFCDRGSQYRSGIFPINDEQHKLATESRDALSETKPFEAEIVTEITPATTFYPAEVYHQDYYLKNPIRYRFYRNGCGRDQRLAELWGDAAVH